MTSTKTILALTFAAAVLGAAIVPTAASAHGGNSHMGVQNGAPVGPQNDDQVGSRLGHVDLHIDRDDRHMRRDDRHRDQTKNVPVETFHVFLTDLHRFIKNLRMHGLKVVKIKKVIVNGNAVADISAIKIDGSSGAAGAF
jgi:hypothetical protein